MSTPRIDPNDPKWTAYALGELGEADVEAIERLLESAPDARALVEEIRSAATAVEEALGSETPVMLTPSQRAAVRAAADAESPRGFLQLPLRWALGAGAVTVTALVVAALQFVEKPQLPATPEAIVAAGPAAAPAPINEGPLAPTNRATAPATESTGNATAGTRATGRAPSGAIGNAATDASGIAATGRGRPSGRPDSDTSFSQVPAAPARTQEAAAEKKAESITVAGATPVVDAQSSRQTFQARVPDALMPAPAAPPPPPPAAFAPRGGGAGRGGGGGVVLGGIPGGVIGGIAERGRTIRPPAGNETYATVGENTFVRVRQEPLATFSIDVDTASYSNVRRFLNENRLPPADAVRVEELVNYFTYDYGRPSGPHPIGTSLAVTAAPWNPQHRLVRIGVKAREIDANRRPPSNLVFLIDVSGSMNMPQKLPLVKSGLKLLVDQLGENDTVSMVVYAGNTGLALAPTRGDQKDVIARAIDNLEAGGSTNGGAGIQLAYNQAAANFIRGGTNRVILMTDGDFNVGITGQGDLTRLIEDRARSGVFLSVLGFGMGNLKDSTLEMLADKGNGHYGYIDTLNEARRLLVEQMSGTLVTVAKDVKIQVDFNPAKVEAYRLIGYENRGLRPEDFNNDLKDAGDMGAGHTVTALFEIVPRGGSVPGPSIDPSVFQPAPRDTPPPASNSNDMLVLRIRYKLPDASTSTRMDVPLADRSSSFASADADFRFAASVAAFGMILKDSPYRGEATLEWVRDTAAASQGKDRGGYRDEFVSLVQKAIALQQRRTLPRD